MLVHLLQILITETDLSPSVCADLNSGTSLSIKTVNGVLGYSKLSKTSPTVVKIPKLDTLNIISNRYDISNFVNSHVSSMDCEKVRDIIENVIGTRLKLFVCVVHSTFGFKCCLF